MLKDSSNTLQRDMDEFQAFCKAKNHRINKMKSSVTIFNFHRSRDFSPRVTVDSEELRIVTVTRILGISISENLKWNQHIEDITDKAKAKFHIFHKLMKNGFPYTFILEVFLKEIRPILEYGAVLFHFALTVELSDMIEEIQKIFLRLLSNYIGVKFSYMEACIFYFTEPLILRRQTLCENFVKKLMKHDTFNLLKKREIGKELNNSRVYHEFQSHSLKHFSSPLVALTRLANEMVSKR